MNTRAAGNATTARWVVSFDRVVGAASASAGGRWSAAVLGEQVQNVLDVGPLDDAVVTLADAQTAGLLCAEAVSQVLGCRRSKSLRLEELTVHLPTTTPLQTA